MSAARKPAAAKRTRRPKLTEIHGHKLTAEQYADFARQLAQRRESWPREPHIDSEWWALRSVLHMARPSVKLSHSKQLLNLGADISRLGMEIASLRDCSWTTEDAQLRGIFTSAIARITGKIDAKVGELRRLESALTGENAAQEKAS